VTPVDAADGHADVRSYLATVAASDNQAVLVAEQAGRLVGMATAAGGIHPAKRGVAEIGIRRSGGGSRPRHRPRPDGGGRGLGARLPHSPACSGRWPRATRRGSRSTEEPLRDRGVLRQSVIVAGRAIDQYMLAKLLA